MKEVSSHRLCIVVLGGPCGSARSFIDEFVNFNRIATAVFRLPCRRCSAQSTPIYGSNLGSGVCRSSCWDRLNVKNMPLCVLFSDWCETGILNKFRVDISILVDRCITVKLEISPFER